MKFRLATLLWLFALVAAAMAAFGPMGIFVAFLVIAFWSEALFNRQYAAREWIVLFVILFVIVALLLPSMDAGREAARRSNCQSNLHRLSLVLSMARQVSDAFPPAASSASGDKPPMSWRVALLPIMESSPLFNQYRQDEPWDGPNNRTLAQQRYSTYACPSDPLLAYPTPAATNYFAVVGDHAAWLPDRGRALDEFPDGPENTILLIEAIGRNTPWTKPEDFTFDEALALLTNPPAGAAVHRHLSNPGYFHKTEIPQGLHVAMADGEVKFLTVPLPRDLAVAMLTADGGETIDQRALRRATHPQLDYAKIYAWAMFAVLAVLPTTRLPRRATPDPAP